MGRHTDQTRQGHNIKFPAKWWKNSWVLLASGLLLLGVMIFLFIRLTSGTSPTVFDTSEAEEVFETGNYQKSAIEYGRAFELAKTDEQKGEALLGQGQSLLYSGEFESGVAALTSAKKYYEAAKNGQGAFLAQKYIDDAQDLWDKYNANEDFSDTVEQDAGVSPEEAEQITSEL